MSRVEQSEDVALIIKIFAIVSAALSKVTRKVRLYLNENNQLPENWQQEIARVLGGRDLRESGDDELSQTQSIGEGSQ